MVDPITDDIRTTVLIAINRQKQTYAVHKLCPLYPQKRTLALLFDHLVSELLEMRRHIEPQRLCSLEVDDRLKLRRRLNR